MKILLAEDEQALSRVYAAALSHKGHEVTIVDNGRQAVEAAQTGLFDLQIFDIMMPEMTGLEALTTLRQSGNRTYTVLLTAMGEIEDKVKGLDQGADDYLTKPISLKELLARVDSLARRFDHYTEKNLRLGRVTLDVAQQELSATNAVRLSSKEASLMELFLLNPHKDLTTAEIYRHVWASDEDPDLDEGYVYIYVSYLRQKLLAIQADLQILGHEGGSYCLVEEADHVS